jgi:hypothetical protein
MIHFLNISRICVSIRAQQKNLNKTEIFRHPEFGSGSHHINAPYMSFRAKRGNLLILLSCLIFVLTDASIAQVNFTSSNLPIVIIDTKGQTIVDDIRIVADMGIIYNGEGLRNNVSDPYNNYAGKIAIELRGSSSQMFPKKQYALETQDDLGNNRNVPLLGMPAENDWILYAPYSDKSLIRNVLAYKLSWDLGRYASRTRLCELVLNGDYRGVYVLMEKIKRDDNRVNISTLNPEEITGDDLTGGYIVKIDKRAGESVDGWYSPFLPYPDSRRSIYYQYHYPKPDDIVPEQETYIYNEINAFESLMMSAQYTDPVTGYAKYIDVNSFIDFFILNEIGKNVDGYRLSTFMYKDKDSIDDLIYIGPIWDFNLAFGNADYYDGGSTEGWQVDINFNQQFLDVDDSFKIPFWWQKLMADSGFVNQLQCRWRYLRNHQFQLNRLHSYIDSVVAVLDESQARNFERWPILDQYIWPNKVWLGSYPDEVAYLKIWLQTRISWIDENLPGLCASSITSASIPDLSNFEIFQNFPNPFNPSTKISFYILNPGQVELDIYDVQGRLVRRIFSEMKMTGTHSVNFDGKDMLGNELASGFYICHIKYKSQIKTVKMLLLR